MTRLMSQQRFRVLAALAALTVFTAPAIARDDPGVAQRDADLAGSVRTALSKAGVGAEANSDLQVSVNHGAVALSGWLRYSNDSQTAISVARSVPGVTTVASNVRTWSSRQRPF